MRHQMIMEALRQRSPVLVGELAVALGCSEMTVRRDLESLERSGGLRRVHGGAASVFLSAEETPYGIRALESHEAKATIGAAAASLLADGETVILDGGTTAMEVARALRNRRMTVMPLALRPVFELHECPGIKLLLPGGEVRPGELSLTGSLTEPSFSQLRFDTCVMGPCWHRRQGGHHDSPTRRDGGEAGRRQSLATGRRGGRLLEARPGGVRPCLRSRRHRHRRHRCRSRPADSGRVAGGGSRRPLRLTLFPAKSQSAAPASADRWPRLAVIAVFFVHGFLFASWTAHIPQLQHHLGLSDGRLGLALLGAPIGSVLAMVVAARLLPIVGSRSMVRLALVGYCVSGPFIGLTGSLGTFFVAFLLWGFFQGTLDVSMNTQAITVERFSGRVLMPGFHGSWSTGALVGAVTGAVAVGLGLSLSEQLLVLAIPCLLVVGWLTTRDDP